MSTNAAVRTAWADNVFASINSGENAFDYDIVGDSQAELSKLNYGQRIDAWSYTVTSSEVAWGVRITKLTFTVTVKHWIQQNNDADGSNYNELIDSFRTVNDYVLDNLGSQWDSTVDYYTGPTVPAVSVVSINGTPCWFAQVVYTGIKQINA